MDLEQLSVEHGFLAQEVEVSLTERRSRPGWLLYDLAAREFVSDAVNWTTREQVEAYIQGTSGAGVRPDTRRR